MQEFGSNPLNAIVKLFLVASTSLALAAGIG